MHTKKKLILLSSSAVFNGKKEFYIEDDYRKPINNYGKHKKEIEEYIKSSEDFTKSRETLLSVKIDQFAASSIDIKLICFTKTKHYLEWMKVKDILAIEIKNIVEKHKASFAFPSTSIYVEKN